MPTVWIPSLLRDLTRGHATLTVAGTSVRAIIDTLEQTNAGIQMCLCDDHVFQLGRTVVVDSQVAPLDLLQTVGDQSEVHFLPAIGGGA
jgi:sulfur-carrier protein